MIKNKISPQLNILFSFMILILIGSVLLALPFAVTGLTDVSYFDHLFTATTSVTITGLTTVNVAKTYTLFGKIIIGLLIQLGGLSITTLAFFIFTIFGAKIGYKQRDLIRENTNLNTRVGIVKTIRKIVRITVIIESIGIILFTAFFNYQGYNLADSFGNALFHTISSFNNAGITIFPDNNSLMMFSNNYFFNILTILLILTGGIGTIVIYDIYEKKSFRKLSFHSKIILKMTLILFLFGAVSFYLLEKDASILNALFHSATTRTAGFYTYDYSVAKNATILITISLMFIGAAPASTAGGIKVTTFYTVLKSITGFIKGKDPIAYKRKIPREYQQKAYFIIIANFIILLTGVIAITIFNNDISLTSILFEAGSALSNTGLSLGITSSLTRMSQGIIIFLMFIGRLGVITFISSFIFKQQVDVRNVDYIDINYLI